MYKHSDVVYYTVYYTFCTIVRIQNISNISADCHIAALIFFNIFFLSCTFYIPVLGQFDFEQIFCHNDTENHPVSLSFLYVFLFVLLCVINNAPSRLWSACT